MDPLHQQYEIKKVKDLLKLEGNPEAEQLFAQAFPVMASFNELLGPVKSMRRYLNGLQHMRQGLYKHFSVEEQDSSAD